MMNSNPKLEPHPDVESLNAFAEQALPERERGEIVAHLAKCGQCREVVFLAQEGAVEAEPELELVAAAPSPARSVERKESWFRSWRVAWAPVGALAVGLSVAYIVHVRHEEIAAEQARAALEAAVHNVEMAATVQSPPIGANAVTRAAGNVPEAPKKLKPELPSVVSRGIAPVAAPPPLSAMASRSSVDAGLQPGPAGTGAPAMDAAAGLKPEPALAAKRQAQELAGEALQARSKGTEKSPQVGGAEQRKKDEFHGGVTAAAPMAQVEANSAYSASAEIRERSMKARAYAPYKAKMAALPSGLISVSTVVTSRVTLAVDGAGGVFLSEDAGSHWVTVTRQWNGRAVAVRLQTKMGASAGVPDALAGGFEIVNDQGQVWLSTEGTIWKAK